MGDMTTKGLMKFNIGKNGLTSGVIESLNNAFKTHKVVRIHVLKGAVRDREKVKKMAVMVAKRFFPRFSEEEIRQLYRKAKGTENTAGTDSTQTD